MNKFTLSALLAATLLGATDYNYEVSPMIGYAFPSDGQELKNHAVYGLELQDNDVATLIKPEFSVLFSEADYEQNAGKADIFRMALNGVYNLPKSNGITPFVKAGLGYETMSHHELDNHQSAFADVGAGVKIAVADQIALKLEAIDMAKFNHFNWDNNFLVMAGLTFGFGEKAQPVAPVAVVVAPKPAPVVVAAPVVMEKPAIAVVETSSVAVVELDSDHDGVLDSADKCPTTPAGYKVDQDGCVPKVTLHLNFATNSDKLSEKEMKEVSDFSTFMKNSPEYKANLVGYTDSVGSDKYNLKLSDKRAKAVKVMLEKQGVAANRLSAVGKGEAEPVATNKTKEGRYENRRVDAVLSH